MGDLLIVAGSAFIILMGVLITRVGLYGEHLDRLKFVSYVKKSSEAPRLRHRYITAGLGVGIVLTGLALLILQFVVFRHE